MNNPDVRVCTLLSPTEDGDNSGGCGGLTGLASSHNRVVSGIKWKLMSYLNKKRAKGE